ncbi:hypothetical protein EV383_3024 [Pseudonocardia sediminis]|uniref:Uncharacterized protein n=1 Tax=Pseudonocardia sediminis TaxID=1397368 RepID=A0A4Q7UWI9_PSEST|nr:hypothetical protein [Pseudonocardia sediminis]RZT86135.1 hypothetical protein EV383_3024 [Pseudonocardia sediminis]
MNIGRTIRVFRAEPVVGPVPGPDPATVESARRVAEARQEPPVEVDADQATPPVRLGG